jgi:hypothetical protein
MRRKSIWIGAALILVLAAASAAGLATLVGSASAQEIEIIRNPPGGGSCTCPANWQPVVCTASDGSHQAFSNACVAGCYGFTHCAEIVIAPHP